jgi:hypothetical protein
VNDVAVLWEKAGYLGAAYAAAADAAYAAYAAAADASNAAADAAVNAAYAAGKARWARDHP